MIIAAAQAKWLKLLLREPDYQSMNKTQELNELELAGFITVTPGGTTWGGHDDFCFNITGDGKLVLREYLKREMSEADWEMNASMACLKANLNGPWTEAAVLRMAMKIARELNAYTVCKEQVKPDLFADFLLAGGDPKELEQTNHG